MWSKTICNICDIFAYFYVLLIILNSMFLLLAVTFYTFFNMQFIHFFLIFKFCSFLTQVTFSYFYFLFITSSTGVRLLTKLSPTLLFGNIFRFLHDVYGQDVPKISWLHKMHYGFIHKSQIAFHVFSQYWEQLWAQLLPC